MVAESSGDFGAVAACCCNREGEGKTNLWWAKTTDSFGHNSFEMIGFWMLCVCIVKMNIERQSEIPTVASAKVHM